MEPAWVLLALGGAAVGAATGWLFFTGLRLTVARLVSSPRPGGLLVASFLARLALVAAVVIGLASLSPVLVVAFVPGLIAARVVMVRAVMSDSGDEVDPSRRRP